MDIIDYYLNAHKPYIEIIQTNSEYPILTIDNKLYCERVKNPMMFFATEKGYEWQKEYYMLICVGTNDLRLIEINTGNRFCQNNFDNHSSDQIIEVFNRSGFNAEFLGYPKMFIRNEPHQSFNGG